MNNIEKYENKMETAFSSSQETVFSTLNADSMDDKIKIYKAVNTPDHRIKEFINMDIVIKDIYIEKISVVQKDESGNEIIDENGNPKISFVPRVIIIDDKGESYTAVSNGIFNAVKRIFELLGDPHTWEKPIKFKVKQINKGNNRNVLTFEPSFK